jgi:hypothetical protein
LIALADLTVTIATAADLALLVPATSAAIGTHVPAVLIAHLVVRLVE